MSEAIKPPTQIAGVQGIASAKQGISQPIQINWGLIVELPAFQMFAAEKHSGNAVVNDALYAEYCQWHEAKGYWPNETPLGELIKG